MSKLTGQDLPQVHTTPGHDDIIAHPAAARQELGRKPLVRALMQVVWPAFLAAGVTVGLVFSVIDPLEIDLGALGVFASREAAYTSGFLFFWVMYSAACSLSWFLASTDRHGVVPEDQPKP